MNWDVSNTACFDDMFFGCAPELDIKPLQNWNISKDAFSSIK